MSARPKTAFARRAELYDRIASDSGLSHAAVVVAWRLINHLNDQNDECFPSVERLAGHLNINESTVRRGVGQLVAAGWFTKKRRGRGGTQYFANYENRAETPAFTTEENRAKSPKKAGDPAQRNRAILPGEPKGEPNHEPRPPPKKVPPLGDDAAMAVRFWNDLADRIGHPKVQIVSKARHRSLEKRLAECGGVDGWRIALAKVEASAFLRGANDRGWRVDFDFMLQQKSFTRLMEGSYDDNEPRDGGGGRAGSQGDRKRQFLAGMFGGDNGRRP